MGFFIDFVINVDTAGPTVDSDGFVSVIHDQPVLKTTFLLRARDMPNLMKTREDRDSLFISISIDDALMVLCSFTKMGQGLTLCGLNLPR